MQIPFDVRQRLLADQLAQQNAAAPKAPYSSRSAGLVSALTGGLGGLMEGMETQRAMQGNRDAAARTVALAQALQQGGYGGQGAPAASPSAPSGAAPSSGSFTSANPTGYDPKATEAMIRASAAKHGVDPDTAVAVARSEGLGSYTGDKGSSFGPFQLHYGSVASGGNAVGGMGDDFTKQTGLDARDPSTVPQQVDFAMKNAAQNGWGAWHGAKNSGISNFQGIGKAPQTAQADMPAPNATPTGSNTLPPGVTPDMISGGQPPTDPSLRQTIEAAAAQQPNSPYGAMPKSMDQTPPSVAGSNLAGAEPLSPNGGALSAMGPNGLDPSFVSPSMAAGMTGQPPASGLSSDTMPGMDNFNGAGGVTQSSLGANGYTGGFGGGMQGAMNGNLPGPDVYAAGDPTPPPPPTQVPPGALSAQADSGASNMLPANPPMPPPGAQSQPDPQMLAAALQSGTPGQAPPAPGPSSSQQPMQGAPSLPSTGPMPPPGAQSMANAGAAPDAPAPGAIPTSAPGLPATMQPQPMGLHGNAPGADPMSAQVFTQQQAMAKALQGGGGAQPPQPTPAMLASAMQQPGGGQPAPQPQPVSAPAGGGMFGGLGSMLGMGGGSPPTASAAPPAQGGGQMAGGGQGMGGMSPQLAAQYQSILSDPYATSEMKNAVMQRMFPQQQIVTGADGNIYSINPSTRQMTKLGAVGTKMSANESVLENGQFTQAPAGPMDAAPGHSIITFGGNNNPATSTPIAATPDYALVPGTDLAMDKTTAKTAPIPGGVNGSASVKVGNTDVPVTTNTGPNGVTAKPLLPTNGPGGPLGAIAPIVEAGAKMDADAAAQKEGAVGQVQGAQKYVDDTAKNANAAATHVQELAALKPLAAASPTGWQAAAAKFGADHGWVTANGDKVQSYDAFRAYLGTQLRQAGSGALRNSEMDKLSDTLGSTNVDPATRAAAIQRVQDGFARQAALGQVASDPSTPDPMAKQAKIQGIQQSWQNADAAIERGANPAAVKARLQQSGVPVVGY